MANNLITQSKLKELLSYDLDTGLFSSRINSGRHDRHKAGRVVGTILATGYRVIHIDNARYVAHRLVWLYVYGVWPTNDLDHINQNKSDNRLSNLREATRKQNMQNVSIHKHNSSGFKGVSWMASRNKWRAYIFISYTQRHLGTFNTLDEAVQARALAEKQFHSHRVGA